jgi:hypothetical protein
MAGHLRSTVSRRGSELPILVEYMTGCLAVWDTLLVLLGCESVFQKKIK